MIYLGIDVFKLKLDCTLLLDPDTTSARRKLWLIAGMGCEN